MLAMAAVWAPRLGPSLHTQPAMSTPATCRCTGVSNSAALPTSSPHDVASRESRSASSTWSTVSAKSCRKGHGIRVVRRKFDPNDSTERKGRWRCGCGEFEGARASSHLNFQLPSRSFAGGCERGGTSSTTLSFEPSDLGCRSASYNNPQFSAERGGGKQPQPQPQPQQQEKEKEKDSRTSLGLYLHDLMDQAGIETTHARVRTPLCRHFPSP